MFISMIESYKKNNGRGNNNNAICMYCGCTIEEGDSCVRIDGLTGYGADGMARYFHMPKSWDDNAYKCFACKPYHAQLKENIIGTHNATWYRHGRLSLEVEAVSIKAIENGYCADDYDAWEWAVIDNNDPAFQYVYVSLKLAGSKEKFLNGEKAIAQDTEEDCTVTTEGHVSQNNLKGFSRRVHTFDDEMMKCLQSPKAGCHMHMGCDRMDLIGLYGEELFTPLFNRIKAMTADERIEKFGRDFAHYATASIGYHGDCINWHTSHNTVEFRLAHVRTADQIIQCAKWWRGTINIINKYGYRVHDSRTASKLGIRLANELNYWDTKYAKGR